MQAWYDDANLMNCDDSILIFINMVKLLKREMLVAVTTINEIDKLELLIVVIDAVVSIQFIWNWQTTQLCNWTLVQSLIMTTLCHFGRFCKCERQSDDQIFQNYCMFCCVAT